jgi:hypothetical protein
MRIVHGGWGLGGSPHAGTAAHAARAPPVPGTLPPSRVQPRLVIATLLSLCPSPPLPLPTPGLGESPLTSAPPRAQGQEPSRYPRNAPGRFTRHILPAQRQRSTLLSARRHHCRCPRRGWASRHLPLRAHARHSVIPCAPPAPRPVGAHPPRAPRPCRRQMIAWRSRRSCLWSRSCCPA